jgi:hypothetical protein
LFDRAVANIESEFFLVGIVEEFDRSVLLLQKHLGWKNAYYLRRNKGTRDRPEVAPALIQTLRERNRWDIKLYEMCLKKLLKTYDQVISDQNVLADFRQANRQYNRYVRPIYDVYDQAKAVLSGNPSRPT